MDITNKTYHTTTIDVAKSNFTTISRVGQKRTYDEVIKGPQRDDFAPVLPEVTNQREFRRPTLKNDSSWVLKASEIHDVGVAQHESEYSQRRNIALTPNPTSDPFLDLAHPAYGLSKQLVSNLVSLGIRSIYPWQAECLLRSGALAGERNLVYTAPTGGGKSLVADILMLKKVIEHSDKKALLVLPYVALVQEKLRWLRKVVEGITRQSTEGIREKQWPSMWRKRGDEDTVRIVGFFGGSKSKATWADMDVAVCTIEKVCFYE
jgi:hypothetical protein